MNLNSYRGTFANKWGDKIAAAERDVAFSRRHHAQQSQARAQVEAWHLALMTTYRRLRRTRMSYFGTDAAAVCAARDAIIATMEGKS